MRISLRRIDIHLDKFKAIEKHNQFKVLCYMIFFCNIRYFEFVSNLFTECCSQEQERQRLLTEPLHVAPRRKQLRFCMLINRQRISVFNVKFCFFKEMYSFNIPMYLNAPVYLHFIYHFKMSMHCTTLSNSCT